jgi:hypothetical protein
MGGNPQLFSEHSYAKFFKRTGCKYKLREQSERAITEIRHPTAGPPIKRRYQKDLDGYLAFIILINSVSHPLMFSFYRAANFFRRFLM